MASRRGEDAASQFSFTDFSQTSHKPQGAIFDLSIKLVLFSMSLFKCEIDLETNLKTC